MSEQALVLKMNCSLPDSVITDEMIPKLVERLVEEDLATPDYIVQMLMCLADPVRRSFIEAAVSCDQKQLEAIAEEVARLDSAVSTSLR